MIVQKETKYILAIDDEPLNLELLEALVGKHFRMYNFLSAENGKQGLELARRLLPEVILLDVSMPEISGYEVCQELKKHEKTQAIPILMVTALGQDVRVRIMSLDAGADAIISKPFETLELVAMIRVLLRVKQSEDRLREQNRQLQENVRVVEAYQSRLRELNHELMNVEELEKKRIADFLHDDIAQNLSLANLSLSAINVHHLPAEIGDGIVQVSGLIRQSIASCKNMIYDLHLPVLNELGLVQALRWKLSNMKEQAGMDFRLISDIDEQKIQSEHYSLLFRVMNELLNNCLKHSRASKIIVRLFKKHQFYHFIVHDNGTGFNFSRLQRSSTPENGGFGLMRIKERLVSLQANITIESKMRKGSRVWIRIPENQIEYEN